MTPAVWRTAAAAFSARLGSECLEAAALEGLGRGMRLGVGFSGGLDSTALLLLLRAWSEEAGVELVALHFDHRLRGRASAADAAWARAACRALRLRCVSEAWAAPSAGEAEARRARLAFFSRAVSTLGLAAVAVGHQAEDVAETLLQRLARGSGSEGLSGPRPVQRLLQPMLELRRPMLRLRRAELEAAARACGIPWREDATNFGEAYERSRVRPVLALLEAALDRSFVAGAGKARERLEAEAAALDWAAEQVLATSAATPSVLPGGVLRSVPEVVALRVLRRWLAFHGRPDLAEQALASVQRCATATPLGARLSVLSGDLVAGVAEPSGPAWSAERLELGDNRGQDGAVVRVRLLRTSASVREALEACRQGHHSAVVETEVFQEGMVCRTWRPGDAYVPFGRRSTVKVQDLFTKARIPRKLRHQVPMLEVAGRGLVWIPGLPPAAWTRVPPGTRQAVQLTYLPPATP